MKPPDPIVADINISPSKAKDDCLSLRVNIIERRTDIAKPHVTRFVAMLVASLLLFSEVPWATYVIVTKQRKTIVIGADSKVSMAISGKSSIVCKILEVRRGVFFSAAGLYGQKSSGFDVSKMAGIAGTESIGVREISERFVSLVSRPLQEAAAAARKWNPEYFAEHFASPTLGVAFMGYEKGVPTIVVHYFLVSFDRQDKPRLRIRTNSCPGDCPRGDDGILKIELGDSKPAQVFVANHPDFWNVGQIEGVRQLLNLTINALPDDVGPPDSILQITPTASKWIDKGVCSDAGNK